MRKEAPCCNARNRSSGRDWSYLQTADWSYLQSNTVSLSNQGPPVAESGLYRGILIAYVVEGSFG